MSRHLLIAGTGRAGTSFLVRYLTALGLDTSLARLGPDAEWNERASAGLENIPYPDATDLPYVIKSPWTYQVIHEVLARGTIAFDAAVIPMRDLTEAAASRAIIELQEIHRQRPFMTDLERTWDHYGQTPGGIVFSTSPVDQARLLAVGFHHLLERLVSADVPVVLLAFPRLIEDADYLHARLAPVLPVPITQDAARAAHAAVADWTKVRVGDETADPGADLAVTGPGHDQLDRAALARTVNELRAERDQEQARRRALEHERDAAAVALAESRRRVAALEAALEAATAKPEPPSEPAPASLFRRLFRA